MTTIKLRGDSVANLLSVNRVYAEREVVLDLTNRNFRVGDGTTAWNALPDWITAGGIYNLESSIVSDIKAQSVNGGDFISGAFRTRDLNTILHNDLNVSIASNQLSFSVSEPLIMIAIAPAYQVDQHKLRFYNVTDSQTEAEGVQNFSGSGRFVENMSWIISNINVLSGKVYELQHRGSVTRSVNGFGIAANMTSQEIYSTVLFVR